MRVLYIKANPKNIKDSASLTVADDFIEKYKKNNPNDEVVELDLYKKQTPHISLEDLNNYKNPEGRMQKEARDFASYDKYIIASPMWNLSIPSILKAYIDSILVSRVTFMYNSFGMPVGLLKGKKALCILARGGSYKFWPLSLFAYDKKYLKSILKFMGIKDITFLPIDNTQAKINKIDKIIASAKLEATKISKKF